MFLRYFKYLLMLAGLDRGKINPIRRDMQGNPPYSSKAVANTFLRKMGESGRSVTHMQLQKLVYYAHGWYLAMYNKPLCSDPVGRWQYGPVFNELYHAFKEYGSAKITNYAKTDFMTTPDFLPNDQETEAFIQKIIDVYGKYDALQLSAMTHAPGTPWDTAQGCSHIDNEEIRKFFVRTANAGN